MGNYKLKTAVPQRRNFDPSNLEDLGELGFFMKNKKWKNSCPFYLEFPYADVPIMCMVKYTQHSLG